MSGMRCWEYLKCGREEGGVNAESDGICPAYPNDGRGCWFVAGTFCGGQAQGTYAEKMGTCQDCDFYDGVMSEEL